MNLQIVIFICIIVIYILYTYIFFCSYILCYIFNIFFQIHLQLKEGIICHSQIRCAAAELRLELSAAKNTSKIKTLRRQ